MCVRKYRYSLPEIDDFDTQIQTDEYSQQEYDEWLWRLEYEDRRAQRPIKEFLQRPNGQDKPKTLSKEEDHD